MAFSMEVKSIEPRKNKLLCQALSGSPMASANIRPHRFIVILQANFVGPQLINLLFLGYYSYLLLLLETTARTSKLTVDDRVILLPSHVASHSTEQQ